MQAHMIKNTQARIFSVPTGNHENANVDVFLIKPGMNTVPDDIIKAMAKSDSAKQWFDLGWLEAGAPPQEALVQKENGALTIDITAMKADDAIKYISEYYDEKELREMYARENRTTVKAAIANQLKRFEDVIRKED